MRDSDDPEKQQAIYFMETAYNFAKEHRAGGPGTSGWYSYLQSNMISFESMEATKRNAWVHQRIQEKAYKASEELAELFGEPELLKGYGRRNATLLSIAP